MLNRYLVNSTLIGALCGFVGIGLLGDYTYKNGEKAGLLARSIYGTAIGTVVVPFLPIILPYTIYKKMWSYDDKAFTLKINDN